MKVIVAGSRSITDYPIVESTILSNYPNDSSPSRWDCEVVHGGAKSVDTAASVFARRNNLEETVFEPDWDVVDEYADALIAIRKNKSRGTTDMIEKALEENLDIYVKNLD